MFLVTMLFGPFVSDAVANVGKIGSYEVTKPPVLYTTRLQELEADAVSTRLLAYVGVTWGEGSSTARNPKGYKPSDRNTFSLFDSAHPLNDTQVGALTKEFLTWSGKREVLTQSQAENRLEE